MNSQQRSSGTSTPLHIKAGLGCEGLSHVFGRRIEADRSWTVYHAFTGTPVVVAGYAMMGLSRQVATDRMLAMNRVEPGTRKDRIRQKPPQLDPGDIGAL